MMGVYFVAQPKILSLLSKNGACLEQYAILGASPLREGVAQEVRAMQPDILVIELKSPVHKVQNMLAKLRDMEQMPRLILFGVWGVSSIYYTSTIDSSPILPAFETAFALCLQDQYQCTRMSYHDETWDQLFGITPETYIRETRLRDILSGVTTNTFIQFHDAFHYHLHPKNGFYLFICELSYMENTDHMINHNCYNYLGECMIQEFRSVLQRYNGGEAFALTHPTFYVYVNAFDAVSVAQRKQLVQQLTNDLCEVGKRQASICFMSPYIKRIEDIRTFHELYQRNKMNHFFCKEKRPMTIEELVPPSMPVDYTTVQRCLDQITDAVQYGDYVEKASDSIRHLLLSLIKPAFDLDLFYYCFNNIKRIILSAYPQGELPLSINSKYSTGFMFDSSIEQECEELIALLRKLKKKNLRQSQLRYPYIYDTVQFIKENYMTELTLSQIAAVVHMNGSYLTKMFKEKTGESVIQYLQTYRINMAAKKLKDSNYSVAEIASLVGFVDTKHFFKAFKKAMGLTPLQYRKHTTEHVPG